MNHALRRRTAGYSLMEILVALGVLAIGLAGVFSLFGIATTTQRRAADQANAALVAARAFAEVQARFSAGDPQAVKDQSFPEFPGYRYDVEAIAVAATLPEYAVKVTVKWKFRGKDAQEVFETVMLGKSGG